VVVVVELPERTRGGRVGLCWWCGCRNVAMDGEMPVGSPNAGAFITGCMVAGSGGSSSLS
jgi:hypothetical protein